MLFSQSCCKQPLVYTYTYTYPLVLFCHPIWTRSEPSKHLVTFLKLFYSWDNVLFLHGVIASIKHEWLLEFEFSIPLKPTKRRKRIGSYCWPQKIRSNHNLRFWQCTTWRWRIWHVRTIELLLRCLSINYQSFIITYMTQNWEKSSTFK